MTDKCEDESGRPECKLGLGKLAAERWCRIAELESVLEGVRRISQEDECDVWEALLKINDVVEKALSLSE
jgi:hypothetical protein